MTLNTHTYTLYVTGMHCAACTLLVSDALTKRGFQYVQVSLGDNTVTVTSHTPQDASHVAMECTISLQEYGYVCYTEPPHTTHALREWLYAAPIVLVVLVGYGALDQLGLTSFLSGSNTSISTAVLVGLVASVSTCLAVIGGLLLSLSAVYAKRGMGVRPQILFHCGRLGGFVCLGGLLGFVGNAVHLGIYGSTILGVLASVVMLLLGVQLLELTSHIRALTLPRAFFDSVVKYAGRSGRYAPVVVGAATFFLPCGFTQSMQVVALSSESGVVGALTMGAFALGTLPVLALISFGSLDLAQSRFRGVFFKVAGTLVVLFALLNLYRALAVFGIIQY